ncbi:MAG: zinc metalloprotease HtpX [Ignavibacteria bacterium]|nr:zinc metalloprotease HtpX [Ignavibacteria bacterium]
MNAMKTFALMALMTALLVYVGGMFGGQTGMIFAFGFALLMNAGTYWFSDKLVLRMYKAKEMTVGEHPEIHRMTGELCQAGGLPMPKLYLIPSNQPNAFATGRNPEHSAVAVTEGIVKALTREELRGVIGHELAHIKHRDILIGTVAATIAGAISMLAQMAQFAFIFGGGRGDDRDGGNPLGAIAMIILAPIAAMLIQMAISRSREFLADEGGARMSNDPLALASALNKIAEYSKRIPMKASPATSHMFIVSPLTGGGLTKLFSTHPPVEERVSRLEALVYGPAGGR